MKPSHACWSVLGILAVAIVVALLLGGCASRVDEVPGNVQSGPIEKVDQRTMGGDPDALPINHAGIVPLAPTQKPTVGMVTAGEYIMFYVYPRTTHTETRMAKRQGFYIQLRVHDPEWVEDVIQRNDTLHLSQLQNMRIDEHGQLVVDASKTLDVPPNVVDGMRSSLSAARQPWRPGGADVPVVRTTIVAGDNRPPVVLSAPQGASGSPYVTPSGAPNASAIEDAIRQAEARAKEMRPAAPTSTQPGPVTPAPTGK